MIFPLHALQLVHVLNAVIDLHYQNLFVPLLYTSGSTGKPKGVLHSTAGYL